MTDRCDTRAMRQVADLLLGRDFVPWPIFRTIATVPADEVLRALRFCHERVAAMNAYERHPCTRERREILRFMRGARQALEDRMKTRRAA